MKASESDERGHVPQCECGGTLHPQILPSFDFTNFAGIPAQLESVPGFRCDRCGGETIAGGVINFMLVIIALMAIQSSPRLSAKLAKYVRRTLQITQQELADRMGIARETVAQWERGEREISPQHDLILRAITIKRYIDDNQIPRNVLLEAFSTLGAVRADPPPKKLRRFEVNASEYKGSIPMA
jgi:transcriptional regulator with XRE-family HTH domain